jgi:IS5 family transposase
MSQLTCADAEYEGKKRKTRREKFLEKMDRLVCRDRRAQLEASDP